MQFFNFWNAQTYHFFRWITANPDKSSDMVQKALNNVEKSEWFNMGECSSTIARDDLAEQLEELLDELMIDKDCGDGTPEIGDVDRSNESLFNPILALALHEISMRAVAEAMLRQHNKWAPDEEIPEAE